jgi:hypothetical protein
MRNINFTEDVSALKQAPWRENVWGSARIAPHILKLGTRACKPLYLRTARGAHWTTQTDR